MDRQKIPLKENSAILHQWDCCLFYMIFLHPKYLHSFIIFHLSTILWGDC